MRKTGRFLTFLSLLLFAGALFSGYKLLVIAKGYWDARAEYRTLSEEAAAPVVKTYTLEEEEPEEDVSEVPIALDWDFLRDVNPDIAGWLYCPGTVINYPVMQTDDNDFYLHHDFRGEYSPGGALFADSACAFHTPNSALVIYGHNMKDGSMFGTLTRYRDRAYFEENPDMWLLTPERDYRVELFACREAEAALNVFRVLFRDEAGLREYADDVISRSYWYEEDRIDTRYQLVVFSTCSYHPDYEDSRLLLYGFLCPAED